MRQGNFYRRNRSAQIILGATCILLFSSPVVATAEPSNPILTDSQWSEAPSPIETPKLASVSNFRDLAGNGGGYQAAFGLRVKPGTFYRSNALTPTGSDVAVLDAIGVKAVYDLRSASEIAQAADNIPPGASYHQHPMLPGNLNWGPTTTPEAARQTMIDMYRSFVTDSSVSSELGAVLTKMAGTDGPQVFHCTAGKDRTGWTAALLLALVGVDRQTIYTDYELTNQYWADDIRAKIDAETETHGSDAAATLATMLAADRTYLEAAFTQMESDYGTVYNYLIAGLGVSPRAIMALSTKLIA